MSHCERTSTIRCHYDVLGVERDADAATIKKAHRKLAIKLHPDKNFGDETAAHEFRLVQQAYECLSEPSERKWYDEHRDAILKGWSASGGGDAEMMFDVNPYIYAGCYDGFGNEKGGFFDVYRMVFQKVYECEHREADFDIDVGTKSYLISDFGTPETNWDDVSAFYQAWESFSSVLNFAWADPFDAKEAESRRIRRAMEDENKKARKAARRERNEQVLALVQFVKRRDPRVKAQKRLMEQEKLEKEKKQKEEAEKRKQEAILEREKWREEADEEMKAREEEDRLAGRLRLADLEDDYDYGGGKKGKKGKKKKKKQGKAAEEQKEKEGEQEIDQSKQETDDTETQTENDASDDADIVENGPHDTLNNADDNFSSEESEEEPDVWRCECCRKDFKSEGQMENHMRSKKHKEAYKKYQKKLEKLEQEIMDDMLAGMAVNDS